MDPLDAWLTQDWRVRAAALIGDTFKIDPVAVLTEPDPLKRRIRRVAHNLVQTEALKASKRASPQP